MESKDVFVAKKWIKFHTTLDDNKVIIHQPKQSSRNSFHKFADNTKKYTNECPCYECIFMYKPLINMTTAHNNWSFRSRCQTSHRNTNYPCIHIKFICVDCLFYHTGVSWYCSLVLWSSKCIFSGKWNQNKSTKLLVYT